MDFLVSNHPSVVEDEDFFGRPFTGRAITLKAEIFDIIEDGKTKIRGEEGILPDRQRLFFAVKQLEDGCYFL